MSAPPENEKAGGQTPASQEPAEHKTQRQHKDAAPAASQDGEKLNDGGALSQPRQFEMCLVMRNTDDILVERAQQLFAQYQQAVIDGKVERAAELRAKYLKASAPLAKARRART